MSTDATKEAWRALLDRAGAKSVLVALADHVAKHNEDWRCWPSVRRLMAYTCLSDSTVRGHLSWLEAKGFISRERRTDRRRTDGGYQYVLSRHAIGAARDPYFQPPSEPGGDAARTPPGSDATTAEFRDEHRRIPAPPIDEPSSESSEEPLSEREARNADPAWVALVESWTEVWPETAQWGDRNESARDHVLATYRPKGLTLAVLCDELQALKRDRLSRSLKVMILPEAIRRQPWESVLDRHQDMARHGFVGMMRVPSKAPRWCGPPEVREAMRNADPWVERLIDRATWDEARRVIVAHSPEAADRIRMHLGGFHLERLRVAGVEGVGG